MADLVGAKTELRRSGVEPDGPVPLPRGAHARRSRSNAEKKLYYCFGCEASGDAIGFVMETEALDFAGRAGAAGRPLRGGAAARERGPARPSAAAGAASGCWPCSSAPRSSTPPTCGRPTRPPPRASTCSAAGCARRRCARFGVGFAPGGWDRLHLGGPARRLHRRRAAGRRAVAAPPRGHRPDRPLPRAGSRSRSPTAAAACAGFGARAMREGQRPEVPQHLRGRGLPQGQPAVRARPGARRRRQGGAAGGGGGLHRRAGPAPGRRPGDGGDHGHRAHRRAARGAGARAAPRDRAGPRRRQLGAGGDAAGGAGWPRARTWS